MRIVLVIILLMLITLGGIFVVETIDQNNRKLFEISKTNKNLEENNNELREMLAKVMSELDSIHLSEQEQLSATPKNVFNQYRNSVFKKFVWAEKNKEDEVDTAMIAPDYSGLSGNSESEEEQDEIPEIDKLLLKSGTAFCIVDNDIMITNNHLLDRSARLALVQDANGNIYEVESIIFANKKLDYCIFNTALTKAQPLKLTDTILEVGENVFTIGNPLGLSFTLSEGIGTGYRTNGNISQHNVPITHGNSGGPLITSRGEMVGLIYGGLGRANINFAVNMTTILKDLERIDNLDSAQYVCYYDYECPDVLAYLMDFVE